MTQGEVLEQLQLIRSEAKTDDPMRRKELLDKIANLEHALRAEWRTGVALYDLGETFGALGELQHAIDYYKEAIEPQDSKSEVPIRAYEQLASFEILYARRLRDLAAKSSGEKSPKADTSRQELFKSAQEHLEQVLKLGATAKRCLLLDSCFRQQVLESDKEGWKQKLLDEVEYYKKIVASQIYPPLNQVTLQFLLNSDEENEKQKAEFVQQLDKNSERVVNVSQTDEPDFWDLVYEIDTTLLKALIQNELKRQEEDILQQYKKLQTRSMGDAFESMFNELLAFLEEMLRWKDKRRLANQVHKLGEALTKKDPI